MFHKMKKVINVIFILLIGSTFYSCVEEPTIEPIKKPYAVLRIGNFSSNNAAMSIALDGKTLNLAYKEISDFFDINAGDRQVTITSNGNVIYDKKIELSSYEEMTLLFFGESSTIDTLNTFQYLRVDEGAVYTDNAPGADNTHVTFVDLVTDDYIEYPPVLSPALDISEGPNLLLTQFSSKAVHEVNYTTGEKQFDFSTYNSATKTSTVHASTAFNLESNQRYIVVLSGNGKEYEASAKGNAPLPVRSK